MTDFAPVTAKLRSDANDQNSKLTALKNERDQLAIKMNALTQQITSQTAYVKALSDAADALEELVSEPEPEQPQLELDLDE